MRNDVQVRLSASLAVLAVSGLPISVAHASVMEESASASAQSDSSNKAEMANWPAEKQAAFKAWPPETQSYYWTLSPERQKLFWSLTDTDKVALSGMDAAGQAKAWERIEGRGSESVRG